MPHNRVFCCGLHDGGRLSGTWNARAHYVLVRTIICTQIAPRVFTLNPDGQSIVVDAGGDSVERVLEAAEGCPVNAIVIEEIGTGRRVFP